MLKFTKKYRENEDGTASIEFVLIFPIFIALFYGVVEISNFNLVKRRGDLAANYAVEFMSRDDDMSFTSTERIIAESIIRFVNPYIMKAEDQYAGNHLGDGPEASMTRSLASIAMDPVVPGCEGIDCEFEPRVEWRYSWGRTANGVRATCTAEMLPDSVKPGGSRINESLTGRSAIVVMDYSYLYRPLWNSFLIPEDIEFHVNHVRKTRGGATLINNQFYGAGCPGSMWQGTRRAS